MGLLERARSKDVEGRGRVDGPGWTRKTRDEEYLTIRPRSCHSSIFNMSFLDIIVYASSEASSHLRVLGHPDLPLPLTLEAAQRVGVEMAPRPGSCPFCKKNIKLGSEHANHVTALLGASAGASDKAVMSVVFTCGHKTCKAKASEVNLISMDMITKTFKFRSD